VYKGLAIASTPTGNFLHASDFRNDLVEQFDSKSNLIRSPADPGVMPGYAPFGAQVLDGHLFVTYALQNAQKHDDVAGMGNGYVDIFNFDGTLFQRDFGSRCPNLATGIELVLECRADSIEHDLGLRPHPEIRG
jgi:uncharacterized protein (TIGR03118 family)